MKKKILLFSKIIYRSFICSIFILSSFKVSASAPLSCKELSKITDDNAGVLRTKYSYNVKGNKGFRTYFHSAPSNQCKIKGLFIIPNDNVIAYSYFTYENTDWMYVMYTNKNGDETYGWVKVKDFQEQGKINTPLD